VALAALLVRPAQSGGAEIVSPHDDDKPRVCLNCHTEEVYSKVCGESDGYCLLAGSVDGLCQTCHIREDCCRPGLRHLPKLHIGARSHPSGEEACEIPAELLPRSLPVQDNCITCRTCHLHRRERPDGYKMLRLVKITDKGVDWTPLCQDCHKDR